MHIVAKKRIKLETPIPVFDVTVSKYHNFVLGNGATVHNCGGMRQVREKNHALLPLTGKVMNAQKAKGDRALLSKAILNILGAIGYDPKQADPLKKLQVGRVVFLADPDPDGHHINCLLHALFVKYLPEMYARGMIYVADMPEFYAIAKDRLFVGETLSSVQRKLDKAKVRADVHHAKGWGEIDHQVLKMLVIDSSAKVIKIKPLSDNDTQVFCQLMGQVGEDPAETKEED
jgi:DNA gyrase/topoisomerase IV subunit B